MLHFQLFEANSEVVRLVFAFLVIAQERFIAEKTAVLSQFVVVDAKSVASLLRPRKNVAFLENKTTRIFCTPARQ